MLWGQQWSKCSVYEVMIMQQLSGKFGLSKGNAIVAIGRQWGKPIWAHSTLMKKGWWLISGITCVHALALPCDLQVIPGSLRHWWKASRHPPSPTSVTAPFLPASRWLGPSGSPSPPLDLHWVGGRWPTWRKGRRPWTGGRLGRSGFGGWASHGVWARGPPYQCHCPPWPRPPRLLSCHYPSSGSGSESRSVWKIETAAKDY